MAIGMLCLALTALVHATAMEFRIASLPACSEQLPRPLVQQVKSFTTNVRWTDFLHEAHDCTIYIKASDNVMINIERYSRLAKVR